MFLTQTNAKRTFLTICRDVAKDEKRAYVTDKAGDAFLTLDYQARNLGGPAVPVTAQFFKDNFARCGSLVKTGLCFELGLRGSNRMVFARRHTAYQDPLDGVLETWRELVVDAAVRDREPGELMRMVRTLERKIGDVSEGQEQQTRTLVAGITRLAIGHRPFEAGQVPDTSLPASRQAAA